MCGHVGVAGTLGKKEVDAFNQLLVADTFRGPHSTGVATVSRGANPEVELFKRAVPAWELVNEYKQYDRLVTQGKTVFLGHNRWATTGKVNHANAHPFNFENLVGAHNGTIRYQAGIGDLEGYSRMDTDSECLFYNIDKHEDGPAGVIPNLVSGSNGAWALVWYDKQANSINFLRNKERELYYAFALEMEKDWKPGDSGKPYALFWASEPAMLDWIVRRNGIVMSKPKLLTVDTLIEFKIPAYNQPFVVEGDNRVKIEGAKERARPFYQAGHMQNVRWPNSSPGTQTPASPGTNSEEAGEKVVPFAQRAALQRECLAASRQGLLNSSVRRLNGQDGKQGSLQLEGQPFERDKDGITLDGVVGRRTWDSKNHKWIIIDKNDQGKVLGDALNQTEVLMKLNDQSRLPEVDNQPQEDKEFQLKDHHGSVMSEEDWNTFLKHAKECSWCGADAAWGDHVVILNGAQFVCESCVVDDEEFKDLHRLI